MLCSVLLVSAALAAPHEITIRSVAETPPDVASFDGIALAFDRDGFAGIEVGGRVLLDIPLSQARSVTLDLERFEVFTDDARLVVASTDRDGRFNQQAAPRPDLVLLRGTIEGEPESRAFLAFGEHTTNGLIEHRGQTWVIARNDIAGWTVIYDLDSVDPALMNWVDLTCGVEAIPGMEAGKAVGRPRGVTGDCPPRLRIAIETDWQFTNLFGGDTNASGEYAATLIGAVSTIYITDLDVGAQICYLRLWGDSTDPWTGGSSQDQLIEFQSYWNANMDDVERHLAHMLSGQGLGGGIAYLSAVCTSYGYAVSGNLSGSFPLPIEDYHGNNWDLMVVSHEIGHNCGTGHTHDYSPPIDGCGLGDCSQAWGGTIMSYCHTCSGGMTNVAMSFHPTVQITIENYLANVGCDLGGDGSPPVAGLDRVSSMIGEPVDIEVLINDYTNDCSDPEILSHDQTSYYGGTIEMVGSDPSTAVLRYTPPAEEHTGDIFQYIMVDGSGQEDLGGVVLEFIFPRPPETPAATEAGAEARYYDLDDPTILPDFDLLEPFSEEIVDQVNYPSTGGAFAGSGLSDNVGAVFEGFVEVPSMSTYTLYVESDDGSRLYVGDYMVVDNNGLHGMQEASGDILLSSGLHAVRVEFFERGGGAGCIVRIAGGGLSKQVVPPEMWWHEVPLAGDVTGDGVVNMDDILMVLAQWGSCDEPCEADIDLDGDVDIDDLLVVVGAWS